MTTRSLIKRTLRPLVPAAPRAIFRRMREVRDWVLRLYAPPSPSFIKRSVLKRHALKSATWVETGTYLGDTAAFISNFAKKVITIEPEPSLYARAKKRFKGSPTVEVINGLSEAVLPQLLPTIDGNLCCWLDGHYSAGQTFHGPLETPIARELEAVEASLGRLGSAVVLVDDIRCFDPAFGDGSYPPLDYLVDWARRNGMKWHIEHDIFVARTGESN